MSPLFEPRARPPALIPYLLEMANIREHCSWVHLHDKDAATEKAKDLVEMAVGRAARLKPQFELTVPVARKAMVIGGGVAGIQASLDMADAGYKVYLVEKNGKHRRQDGSDRQDLSRPWTVPSASLPQDERSGPPSEYTNC